MKNIIKIFSLLLFVSSIISCSTKSDDLGFSPSPERGWVQFLTSNPNVYSGLKGITPSIDIDLNIQVPTTSSDLTVNYDLVSVSGADPNSAFDTEVVIPAGLTSYAGPDNTTGSDYSYLGKITFDLDRVNAASLTEPMVFDVVLTGTSSPAITAGLSGESFPISQRVVIYSTASLEGLYDVDEVFISGLNEGLQLGPIFGETYVMDLSLDPSDSSGFTFIINNAADTFLFDGTIMTFNEDGTLSFDDGFGVPGQHVVALFALHVNENTGYSHDGTSFSLFCNGALGNFGPYQFDFTQQ